MSTNRGIGPQQQWRATSGSVAKNIEAPDRPPSQGHSSNQPFPHHHSAPPPNPHYRERGDKDRDKNHETVCNLLSMLTLGMDQQQQEASSSSGGAAVSAGDHNRMLLLNLTNSPESCNALRRAGCIPLLIEILHPPSSPPPGIRPPDIIKNRAAKALKNIVQFNPDEKLKRKELRVLKLLEGIRAFSKQTEATSDDAAQEKQRQAQQHPNTNMTSLMKLSFDEEHRNIMCLLGAIHALAELIVCDHILHGNAPPELKDDCLLIRRYSGMTLTNLTFGDGTNKSLLCGMKDFMEALVSQLECHNEDVCQVTASVLRNLSWRADSTSRASLRDSNAVPKLTLAAIKSTKESTLKATLSALWNLSAHSVSNKSAICTASTDALPFLISLLRPNNPMLKTLKTPMNIIENAGGILRNISTEISSSSEHRKVLRENHCYEILLEHLKSCSLIVVSNACGTLWNLSGGVGCEEDQRKLLDLNAVPMLKNLIYSKHDRISQGASAALRNLLSSRFAKDHMLHLDSRLTAQIYSPNAGGSSDRAPCGDSNQESPGSDGEYEFEFNSNVHQHQQFQQQRQIIPHPVMTHPHLEPPAAHQHSSSAAASIFQRIHSQPAPHPVAAAQTHFHPPQNFSHPGNYLTRPSSINYSMEPEPLDLTMTSAKSSPIHIISAAEFGGITGHHHLHHSHSHHRKQPKSAPFVHSTQYVNNAANGCGQKPFFNPPSLLHQTGSSSRSNSPMRFNYPSAKFNRSCPEILSRLNTGHGQISAFVPAEQKPLDFSSNSHSASSSLRGAGEAAGEHNDSANGGDTTFNYSLQYTELDDDNRSNSRVVHRSNEETSKSEDTLKTYCYEGTPHNFSISNSCQDLVHEIEMEKAAAESSAEKNLNSSNPNKPQKLQPIDETPKSYYVENTPAVFSRTSSLSSINSSGGLNAGENKAEPLANDSLPASLDGKKQGLSGEDLHQQGSSFQHNQSQHHMQAQQKRRSGGPPGTFTPARVTFSAEETPLMFSRCSSVASLDSLDVGMLGAGGGGNGLASHNDDDLSDFSRRASEVVSPSDLPDSPRAMAPPVRITDRPMLRPDQNREEKHDVDDGLKVFSMEEKSGLNSCRSLSPLTIDGEELPVLSKGKLKPDLVQDQVKNGSNGLKEVLAMERTAAPILSEGQRKQENALPEKKKANAFPDDEVTVFAVEGTPFYGVSNATSLSDLTTDLDNIEPPKQEVDASVSNKSIQPVEQVECVGNDKQTDSSRNGHKVDEQAVKLTAATSTPSMKPSISSEPIYSDVQLLQKCIRIGKAAGIPKSKSEYKIVNSELVEPANAVISVSSSTANLATQSAPRPNAKKTLAESKSQNDFDDPDLAALIMKGRNRPKEKERSSSKGSKSSKSHEKDDLSKSNKSSSESDQSKSTDDSKKTPIEQPPKESIKIEIKEIDENSHSESDPKSDEHSEKKSSDDTSTEGSGDKEYPKKDELKVSMLIPDPSQISTTSLGSEWNDETPTFSSPIPSMSISTAFKLVGGMGEDDSSCDKDPPPLVSPKAVTKSAPSMQSSMITMSMMNNELLDNIDPPSTFSNVVSSSDCVLPGSPQRNLRMQTSTSDKLNKKWKALNDGTNTSSIHSNLSMQRPPLDLDLENSMMSVASIKSEIYEHELSSTASFTNDIFQSAMEEMQSPSVERIPGGGDTSIGGNTYTIFPPEMGDQGKSADAISEGGNTVVSDDFTDAEEIEDYETAPADDVGHIVHQGEKSDEVEKSDASKPEETEDIRGTPEPKDVDNLNSAKSQNSSPSQTQFKPLMEVHPLEPGNKFNTFKVSRSPLSPRASPKQKRRDDPERYKTRTIAALQSGRSLLPQQTNDTNGNPLLDETRFATFRVGGPKIVKPVNNTNSNTPSIKSSRSNSPESTPGNSPKGIRGRRKPLYSSLPPSAITKKKVAPPVPPKPTRNLSPVRPPSAGSGSGSSVYVRPTRTSELRIAANSRDGSPGRGGSNSRTSSNSSLNLIHTNPPSRNVEQEFSSHTGPRPKVAPKPPVRTTPSVSSATSSKPFSGSSYNVVIKTSNSSFGFGQQKVADGSVAQNMKGYSTLPKSSKLGGDFAGMYMPGSVPSSQNGEGKDKESICGSEKSQGSKIGKLTNLFKKMDFHRTSKEIHSEPVQQFPDSPKPADVLGIGPEKKPSKFSNFFGRKKEKAQPKPFLDTSVGGNNITVASGNIASVRGPSGIWVRRDGENKAMVAPFNYVPPPGHPSISTNNMTHLQPHQNNKDLTTSSNISNNANVTHSDTQASNSNTSAAAAGSAKITTV